MLLIPIFIFMILLISLMVISYFYPHTKSRMILKILTSLGFVCIGGIGYFFYTHPSSSAIFLFIGLILCAFGDIALAFSHNKPLKYNIPAVCGITFFGLAHLSFITCFIILGTSTPTSYLLGPMLLACLFLLLLINDPFDFGSIRYLLAIYAFIISTMLLTAFFTSHSLIIAGSSLFIISDIILCFAYFFGDRQPILRPLNYLFYYTGQLLLAFVLFTL